MKKSMVEGNPFQLMIRFSIPLLLGNMFQQFYNMVDAAIVGQTLGSSALAAVGSSSSVQFLVLGFCLGMCQGFAIPVAQKFGAREEGEMRRYVFNGAILTAIIAAIVTVAVVLLCPSILHILQVNEEIFANAYAYLVVIFAGIPFTLLYNYLSGILRGIGDSKTPFYFLAFSSVLNIGLDFFCILVLHWGCAGAAIATITSQAVSGILCLLLIAKKFEFLHIRKEDRVCNGTYVGKLLGMGLPMGVQFSITAIGSMIMQSSNNSLGTIYTSGFTAAMRIKQLMMSPFDAIASAVSTYMSQNYGAKKVDRIKQGLRTGYAMGVVYGVFAAVIMVLFGRTLSMFFVSASESAILDASAIYLRRIGYFYPALGLLFVSRLCIQGLGYSTFAMAGGILEMVGRTFVCLLFVPKFHYTAITWADQAAWMAAVVYLIPMCFYIIRKVSQEIKEEEALAQLQG